MDVWSVTERRRQHAELRESMGIERVSDVMRRSRLRWDGACVEEGEGMIG